MKFDYKKAIVSAQKTLDNKRLELILLGHSGAGKSYAIGTLGVKTLYLYAGKESHGPSAASTEGGDNIVPLRFDRGMWPGDKLPVERAFTADEQYLYLEMLLKDHDYIKGEGYGAIAIDGLPVLEAMVKETSAWKERCKTASGKHNTFKETEASQETLGNIIGWMKAAAAVCDLHIIVTGIIDVKEKDGYGAVVEAVPKMGGYGLCESMIQFFGDVVVKGKMSMNGETKYKFQFLSDLTRTAKDEAGNLKKAMNFSPRITGVKNVPDMMDADLAQLAKLKAGG